MNCPCGSHNLLQNQCFGGRWVACLDYSRTSYRVFQMYVKHRPLASSASDAVDRKGIVRSEMYRGVLVRKNEASEPVPTTLPQVMRPSATTRRRPLPQRLAENSLGLSPLASSGFQADSTLGSRNHLAMCFRRPGRLRLAANASSSGSSRRSAAPSSPSLCSGREPALGFQRARGPEARQRI